MTASHMRMGAPEWTLMLILSAVWGSSFFFFKVLVRELPPLTVVLGRVGLAAVALNLFLLFRRDHLRASPLLWRDFLILGILNNAIPFTLIAWGETRLSSGMASILNATTPVFAVLVAHLLTPDEKLSWNRAAGVLLSFAGVVVLVGPAAFSSRNTPWGQLACLAAALFYSLGGLYGRRFKHLPVMQVTTGQLSACALLMLPLAGLVDHPWNLAMPSASAWEALAGISLICTALAYLLFFRILAVAGATNLMLVTFLLPVSAMTRGYFALGEKLQLQAFAGIAFIGAGLAAIDGRLPRKLADLRR